MFGLSMSNLLFKSTNLGTDHEISCVDGRSFFPPGVRIQMLGGSINVLILLAIVTDKEFDESFVRANSKILLDAGVSLGVHRGSHAHGGNSDCGFADRLKDIINTAKINTNVITKKINQIAITNGLSLERELELAMNKLRSYDENKIKISANELVALFEQIGASVVEMQGDHGEKACFVNLVVGTTHDTNSAKEQIFNLDLWEVVKEGKLLGIDDNLTIGLTLILYLATEMVLVEAKGKPALEVFLNKQ